MLSTRTLTLLGLGLLAAGCGPATPEPANPTDKPSATATPVSTASAAACAEGKAECDGDPKTACETDLQSAAQHCGACGTACSAGQSCVSGACQSGASISASGANACVVRSGQVYCWGDNSYNLMASGSKGPRATPVKIEGIDKATVVRTGRRVGCALTSEGKIACFHDGAARELPLISDVTDIALQDSTVLILHKNGKLAAVDVGDNGRDLKPVEIPSVKDAISIAAATYHACVVQKSGEVVCWGDPSYTGSGKDTTNMDWSLREELGKKPTKVKDLKDAVQLSLSETHSCAVRKSKQIACWGSNWSGELGDGSQEHRFSAVNVQLLDDAVEVTVGYHHSCARRSSGKVVCWGASRAGQLGSGSAAVKGMVEVQGLNDAAGLAAGEEMSCAARTNGSVSCWGSASRGRLGNGAISDYPTPQPVRGLSAVKEIALGESFSCALDASKKVSCWGLPGWSDDEAQKRGFEPSPLSIGDVEYMSMKDSGLCLIDKSKSIYCDSSYSYAKGPRKADLGNVKAVRIGSSAGHAVTPSGQVVLWRRDWSKADQVQKINLAITDAVSVAHDSNVVCAVRKSGKVGCVAYSYRTFEKENPIKPTGIVEVPGVTDAASIVGESGELCILRKTGEVGCFSPYRVPPPVDPKEKKDAKDKDKDKEKPLPIEVRPVKGIADATQIAMGGASRCALSKGGTVSCWGSNSYGQLGSGDYSYSWDPVAVSGLSDVTQVALGSSQVCALKKSGEVLCWGSNTSDQAGQPAASYARGPVPVLLPKD